MIWCTTNQFSDIVRCLLDHLAVDVTGRINPHLSGKDHFAITFQADDVIEEYGADYPIS